MQMGMVGLGRMGLNMARRLARGGHQVVVYNRSVQKARDFAREEGGDWAQSLEDLVAKLKPPRVVWLMLPADTVDAHLDQLAGLLASGDLVVEGGNSLFKDDLARAPRFNERGVSYLDAGVSGGIWGLKEGYCIMVGGPREGFGRIEPLLDTLTSLGGYLHTGPVGSGHYVKMVHNGIEYGLMQAYAEGFNLLNNSRYGEDLDLQAVAELWNHGSVVRSWLLELLTDALGADPGLTELEPFVDDSGEGRWTVDEAVATSTPAPVMTLALMARFDSRGRDDFAHKVLAALRRAFGGHAVKKTGD